MWNFITKEGKCKSILIIKYLKGEPILVGSETQTKFSKGVLYFGKRLFMLFQWWRPFSMEDRFWDLVSYNEGLYYGMWLNGKAIYRFDKELEFQRGIHIL